MNKILKNLANMHRRDRETFDACVKTCDAIVSQIEDRAEYVAILTALRTDLAVSSC